eukprot:1010040_1
MDPLCIDLTGDIDSIEESIEQMNLSPISSIKSEMNSINSYSALNYTISSISSSTTTTTQPPPFIPLSSLSSSTTISSLSSLPPPVKVEEKSWTPLSTSSSFLFKPPTKPCNNTPSSSLQQTNTPPPTSFRSRRHPPPTHKHNQYIQPPTHNNNNRKRRLEIENDEEYDGLMSKRRRLNDYEYNMELLAKFKPSVTVNEGGIKNQNNINYKRIGYAGQIGKAQL